MSTPLPAQQERIVVARLPVGVPTPDDFALESAPLPIIVDGELLVRTIDLSLDPYLRSVMAGRHLGHAAAGPGRLMPGRATAQVVASRDESFAVGAYVLADTGWQEYAAIPGSQARRLDPHDAPLTSALGVLGMPGLTAWAGVTQLLSLRAGQTFVVSAALGGVGSAAGQLARHAGCRVIGIAGSEEKCALVVEHFGFDACINYHKGAWEDALRVAAPDGIDAYFDNVGGAILEGVLRQLRLQGHIVLCGLIEQYNTGIPYALPLAGVIGKRAHLHGLVVYDHEPRMNEYLTLAQPMVRNGTLRFLEDRAHGLSAAPAAFQRLMSGHNIGKAVVAVSAA